MKRLLIKLFLFNLLLIFWVNVFAQSDSLKIDSLNKVLLREKEDSNKVNTLYELSINLWSQGDTNKSIQSAMQSLSLAQKINFEKGKGKAFELIGEINAHEYDYDEAIKDFMSALPILLNVKDKPSIARVYFMLGTANLGKSYYAQASRNLYFALKLYEDLGSKKAIAGCLYNINIINAALGNHIEAMKNLKQALSIAQEIGDSSTMAACFTGLGEQYFSLNDYDSSLQNHLSALQIFEELGSGAESWGIPWSYRAIGTIYKTEGDSTTDKGSMFAKYKIATTYYHLALQGFKKNKDIEDIAECFIRLGDVNIKLKKYAIAKGFIENGLAISTEKNIAEELENGYRSLYYLDSIEGNYTKAFEHYRLYILYRDSIVNKEILTKSLTYKMQYEFDKKEVVAKAAQVKKDAEAKRIKNQQYFVITALGIVVLAVIIIALIQFRNNRNKQKANKVLEATLTNLKSTQAQLIQSEKMASLGELTAGIAHEIQNPLNFVNNFSEVNKEMVDEATEEIDKGNIDEVKNILNDIKGNSEKINHHGKRADAIVKSMLEHSRASTGIKEPTDINKLADEYLRLAYHGMRAKNKSFEVDLQTDFDESVGKINVVPQEIGRVLLNLCNNAFYVCAEQSRNAMNERQHAIVNEEKSEKDNLYQPTVWVTTKRGVNSVTITVRDNGGGIPDSVKEKIFQPFFTTKPTGEGTGLGLSLSYDIIKAHGGEIKVENREGEGLPAGEVGSEFVIRLPLNLT